MTIAGAVLELNNVGVTYSGARGSLPTDALGTVSLALHPGKITGLAGPNGAGKTSLLEVCIGALAPTRGSIHWFGVNTFSAGVRRRVGFSPDVPPLPRRMKGIEVLQFFAALDGMQPAHAAKRIQHLAERLKVSSALEQRVESLSRGTLQRLGLLQALTCERDILLCDEPFAPLDPVAQVDLRVVLREEANRGAAVLISSHQLDQLDKVADEIVILGKGAILQRLTGAAIRAKQLVVISTDMLTPDQIRLLQTAFGSGWTTSNAFRIPFESDAWDEAAFRQSLPQALRTTVTFRRENFSLESAFFEALRATPTDQ